MEKIEESKHGTLKGAGPALGTALLKTLNVEVLSIFFQVV
jgi:hypothetical protein